MAAPARYGRFLPGGEGHVIPAWWPLDRREVRRMRKLRIPASAGLVGLLFLLSAACAGSGSGGRGASASVACANPSSPHRAYVVVEHLSGAAVDKCVGFTGSQIAGDQLMKESGLVYQTQHFSFGDAVCAIDREPASFDQCLPQHAPYWGLWTETRGG